MTIINTQTTFRVQTFYTTILLMLFSIFSIGQCYGVQRPLQYNSCSDDDNNGYFQGPGYNHYNYEGEPGAGIVPSGRINLPPEAGHYGMYLGLGNNNNNNYSISSSFEEEENQIDAAPPRPYSADQASDEEQAKYWKWNKLLAFLSWQDMYKKTEGGPLEDKEGFTTTILPDELEEEKDSVIDDSEYDNNASRDNITIKMLGSYVIPFNNINVVGPSNIISLAIIYVACFVCRAIPLSFRKNTFYTPFYT